MRVIKPYEVDFMNYGKIIIPMGIQVTHQTADGIDEAYCFVKDRPGNMDWIDQSYPDIANILKHDMKYHSPNIPHRYIDKYAKAPDKMNRITVLIRHDAPFRWYKAGEYYLVKEDPENPTRFMTLPHSVNVEGFRIAKQDCVIIKDI